MPTNEKKGGKSFRREKKGKKRPKPQKEKGVFPQPLELQEKKKKKGKRRPLPEKSGGGVGEDYKRCR